MMAVATLHLCAAPVPWLVSLPAWLAWTLTVLVAGSWVRIRRSRFDPRGSRHVRRLVWDAQGRWLLEIGDGGPVQARLQGEGLVQPWCVVLNFATGKFGRQALVLFPRSVSHQTLRRLRVRLRTEQLHGR
jgi:hypothetical protein